MANYDVLSPDGFPITWWPFASKREARAAAKRWCKNFQDVGYYVTACGEKIPLGKLPLRLEIVEHGW